MPGLRRKRAHRLRETKRQAEPATPDVNATMKALTLIIASAVAVLLIRPRGLMGRKGLMEA